MHSCFDAIIGGENNTDDRHKQSQIMYHKEQQSKLLGEYLPEIQTSSVHKSTVDFYWEINSGYETNLSD